MKLNQLHSKLPILAAGIAACLVIVSTSKYGIGVSPDSACYFSIAENLTKGNGFAIYDLEPAVAWPPLYPSILALGKFLGLEISNWARILNALLIGLIVFLSSKWILENIKNRFVAFVGIVGLVLSPPIIFIESFAWSELPYSLLVLLALIQMTKLRNSVSLKKILLLSLIFAAACLTRYIGITLVLFGLLWILYFLELSKLKKIILAATLAVVSLSPLAIWFIRNYSVSSTIAGPRAASSSTLTDNILFTADALSSWLMPESIAGYIRAPLALFVVLLTLYFWLIKLKELGLTKQIEIRILLFGGFSAFGICSLVLIGKSVAIGPIDWRFTSPTYIPVLFTMLVLTDLIVNHSQAGKRLPKKIVLVLASLWLLYLAGHSYSAIGSNFKFGAGGYATDEWQGSELVDYLKSNSPMGKLYSNYPDGIYALTGLPATISPRKTYYASLSSPPHELENFQAEIGKNGIVELAWFNRSDREMLFTIQEIRGKFDITLIKEFADGFLYRVSMKPAGV